VNLERQRFPRERTITLYGRMPVLEALLDRRAVVEKVVIARTAQGEAVDRILAAALDRGVRVERADGHRVTRLSRNGRHDQGVVADVASPGLVELDDWLTGRDGGLSVIVLDGVTNPANVGMILRTVVAAGLDGVVLPRTGSPDVGPLVVKASAGIALAATILRCSTSADAVRSLARAQVGLIGLAADADAPLWEAPIPRRSGFVLGNETVGISPAVSQLVDEWCAIPLAGGVDSLNVASTAAIVAFELARRRAGPSAGGVS
jgi:23S rRNA (guanosine2251-2'-O)-methyltransferase